MRPIAIPCAELCAAYAAGQTTLTLAQRYGCSPTTIAKRLRACGVSMRAGRFKPAAITRDALLRLYEHEHLPITAIASHFGVTPSTIDNKRRHYGIAVRGRARAHPIALATPVQRCSPTLLGNEPSTLEYGAPAPPHSHTASPPAEERSLVAPERADSVSKERRQWPPYPLIAWA